MSTRLRFPFAANSIAGRSEANQIITLHANAVSFAQGGPAAYTSIAAWKLEEQAKEAPYTGVVLEFTGSGAITIGTGTVAQQIGLFGVIGDMTTGAKTLLGILGILRGNAAPQIPIISSAIGFSQKVCDIAVYDGLAIGGIDGAITFTGADPTVTVKARPIRYRSYYG